MKKKDPYYSWFIDTIEKTRYTEKYCKDYNIRVMNTMKKFSILTIRKNAERVWYCRKWSRCGKYHVCPICSNNKRQERYNLYKELFDKKWYCLEKDKLFFLTLTLWTDISLERLKYKITKYLTILNKKMKTDKKSVFYLFDWYTVSIEKKCKNGVWNLHLHLLVKTKRPENEWLLFLWIQKEWKEISKAEQVNIQTIQGQNAIERKEHCLNVIDYIWKWDKYLEIKDKIVFMKVFYGVSVFRNYGCFKADLSKIRKLKQYKEVVEVGNYQKQGLIGKVKSNLYTYRQWLKLFWFLSVQLLSRGVVVCEKLLYNTKKLLLVFFFLKNYFSFSLIIKTRYLKYLFDFL